MAVSPEPIQVERLRTSLLLEAEFFSIERVEVLEATEIPVVTNGLPVIWMVTAGGGCATGGGEEIKLRAGSTVLHPAQRPS